MFFLYRVILFFLSPSLGLVDNAILGWCLSTAIFALLCRRDAISAEGVFLHFHFLKPYLWASNEYLTGK